MKLLKQIENNIHLLIFALFTAFEGAIISKLVLFGDDYYYTSFFYKGWDHFLSENIHHWLETNGRALVHLIDEILLANGSIIAWKIFGVICIALIAFFAALIASSAHKNGLGTAEFKISLVISCTCIAFISIFISHQTLYWATGFLNYVFPILTTLMLYYFIERAFEKEHFSLWLIPLAFLGCAGTEQNAFAALSILLLALARMILSKKKPNFAFLIALVVGIIGFISLFAAPGNAVRTTYYADFYSLPLVERIFLNIKRVLNLIFRTSGASRALVIFFGAAAIASFEKLRGIVRLLSMSLNSIAVILLLGAMHFGVFQYPAVALAITAFGADVILSVISAVKEKDQSEAYFPIMAGALQGAMLISPEMGPRTVIASVILLIIPTARCVCRSKKPFISLLILALLFMSLSEIGIIIGTILLILLFAVIASMLISKSKHLVLPLCLLIMSVLMLDSLAAFHLGYSENYAVHKENERLLAEYRISLENGGEHILKQKYLPNGTHKYTMPYDDPYHMHWFKIAKKIPIDTEIKYE